MTDGELDELFGAAKLLLMAGHWSVVNDLLEHYANAAWRMDVDLLLGWTITTLTVKDKLSKRARFIEECIKFHDPKLWKGLK